MTLFNVWERLTVPQEWRQTKKEFLSFVSNNVLEWNEYDKKKISKDFSGIRDKLWRLALPFPDNVYFIKTTGLEEGGAAYTRANAIILQNSYLQAPIKKFKNN